MRPGSGERPVAHQQGAGATLVRPVAARGGEDLVSGEPSRILLAGDVHGFASQIEYLARIATRERCEVIVQLGDFGYWPHQEDGLRFLRTADRLLTSAGVELLFLDGNHENFDRLLAVGHPAYGFAPVTERIRYIPRGTRWRWQGVTFLGLGGAHSIDKEERLRYERTCSRSNWLWWPQETITDEEAALAAGGGRVDVLVCHDCPWTVALAPHCGPEYLDELATELNRRRLQRVVNGTGPLSVFHAHYHVRHSSLYFSHTLGRTVPVEGLNMQDTGEESWRVLDLAAFRAAHPERFGGSDETIKEGVGVAMATGTVKWFSDDKGYGFITPDSGGQDLFVHHTAIAGSGFKTLAEGAKVEFEVTQGQKGPQATDVQVIAQ